MSLTGEIQFVRAKVADSAYDQIEERQEANFLNLFLFSVGGVFFGIEADQVAEVTACKDEKADDLFWFHEEMGYGGKVVEYHSPATITIRSGRVLPYRVIIDSMEDIAEFSCNDIRVLPPLLEPMALRRGIWGVLPQNGRMILLLDFKRLLRETEVKTADSKPE